VLTVFRTEAADVAEATPAFATLRAFPNPFSDATRITFPGPVDGGSVIRLTDASGRLIRSWDAEADAKGGSRDLLWDGRDFSGRAVRSGVYFVRLEGAWRVGEQARSCGRI
jgi:hypothetical protein